MHLFASMPSLALGINMITDDLLGFISQRSLRLPLDVPLKSKDGPWLLAGYKLLLPQAAL